MKLTVRNTCSDGPGTRDWFETRDFEVQVTDEMVMNARRAIAEYDGTTESVHNILQSALNPVAPTVPPLLVCAACGSTHIREEQHKANKAMSMKEKMAIAMRARWELAFGRMARAHWDDGFGEKLADAALDVMMRPTVEMTRAALRVDRTSMPTDPEMLGRCMAAMIGAAKDGK